jgi:hypothetical protein
LTSDVIVMSKRANPRPKAANADSVSNADLDQRALDHDAAQCEANSRTEGVRQKQADILIQLASDADLFRTPAGDAFADIRINGHRETWQVRAKTFKRWLAGRFFAMTSSAPNSEALQSAINVIEARAHFNAEERQVHLRVGGLAGKLYLDLGDKTWQAAEISAGGWQLIDDPPVRFRRAAGMQPLPEPVAGGSVESLRAFLNVQSDEDFVLIVAWLLAGLRNCGPYPVLALSGEQGSAKSTFAAILRALIDPNTAPLRALPRDDRDLFIAARNGHLLAFDNVSGLPTWISDTLCRLATGGGFALRALYTDQDEVLFDAVRPVILNGIEDIVSRPDLADRAIFLTLAPIPDDRRRPEQELWSAFEQAKPMILGALLDAVVEGLEHLPDTHLSKLPRMADFAKWATACETAIWQQGTFLKAYSGNQEEAVASVIEADPVAVAVRTLAMEQTVWTGNASALLGTLSALAGERISKSKSWPDSPRVLSGRLRRAATFMRKIGIEVAFERGDDRDRTRTITIAKSRTEPPHRSNSAPDWVGISSSAPSAPSINGRQILQTTELADDPDGLDAKKHTQSGDYLGPPGDNPADFLGGIPAFLRRT